MINISISNNKKVRKSVVGLKICNGIPVGGFVTLMRKQMHIFLLKYTDVILSSV
jgi:ribosomal protein L5